MKKNSWHSVAFQVLFIQDTEKHNSIPCRLRIFNHLMLVKISNFIPCISVDVFIFICCWLNKCLCVSIWMDKIFFRKYKLNIFGKSPFNSRTSIEIGCVWKLKTNLTRSTTQKKNTELLETIYSSKDSQSPHTVPVSRVNEYPFRKKRRRNRLSMSEFERYSFE